MYKAQAEAQQGDAQPGPDASQNGQEESSDVEDVDFEEVKQSCYSECVSES